MPPKSNTTPSIRRRITQARKQVTGQLKKSFKSVIARNEIAESVNLLQGKTVDYDEIAQRVLCVIRLELDFLKDLKIMVASLIEKKDAIYTTSPPTKVRGVKSSSSNKVTNQEIKRAFHVKLAQQIFRTRDEYIKKYGEISIEHEERMVGEIVRKSRDNFNKSFHNRICVNCGGSEFKMVKKGTQDDSPSKQKKRSKKSNKVDDEFPQNSSDSEDAIEQSPKKKSRSNQQKAKKISSTHSKSKKKASASNNEEESNNSESECDPDSDYQSDDELEDLQIEEPSISTLVNDDN